ncbi:hypothetical protein TH53_07040 [Pedobacter lusitanus]|uniref:Beta-lactamase-related domain-containing protein n=2 Tax=Pedobacter lusitanus TaxID=1503925 RepID=A0A0D0GP38_9SPHI|nr:hypothetical protein TH53_07040 [Pedobacter lusitanus]
MSFCFLATILWYVSCTNRSKHEQIDRTIKNFYDKGAFNGAILVAERGRIVYDTAMGSADFIKKRHLDTSAVFYLASLSKQFTAMGIMLLEQEGKLAYQDTLGKYFPELPAFTHQISIRNLLNHTSGLPDYFESANLVKPGLSNVQVFSWLGKQRKLNFSPGSKYLYSNTGYVLLAMIIEKLSHKSFSQFMKQMIFEPLEMQHTLVFDQQKIVIRNRALGFDANKKIDDYAILTSGDGGIFSTTHDLFKWDQALYSGVLINQSKLSEAYQKAKLKNGNYSDYGFGWNIKENQADHAVYHTGELNGYQTFIYRDINRHHTIIILTNQGRALQMWPVADRILKILRER